MLVMVIGGGRTGAQLARALLKQDHEVHIVENRKEVLSRIHRELPTESIFEGDPIDPSVLERAGIREANVVVSGKRRYWAGHRRKRIDAVCLVGSRIAGCRTPCTASQSR